MPNNRTTREDRYSFAGNQQIVATGSVSELPWRKVLVGSATVAGAADGMTLTLVSTNEAESARFSFDDVLSYDIDEILYAEFLVKLTSSTLTNSSAIIGMASAGNATIDTIATQASFGFNGSTALIAESDDGTNDNNDIATGITLVSGTWTRLRIDFATGTTTISPGPSKGGKSNILFSAGLSSGAMRRVATGTRFDASNYSSGLQPYVQYQKASSADAGTLAIREICIGYKDVG